MEDELLKHLGPFLLGAAGLGGLLLFRKGAKGAASSLWSSPAEPHFAAKEPLDPVCDPENIFAKPGVLVFRDAVLARFGGYDAGIPRACSVGGPTEHHEGRAFDWGVLAWQGHAKVDVQPALDIMLANDAEILRRAGVMYFIYNRRIWRSYPDPLTGVRGYGPYNGASPHTDHVHFSFSRAGANGKTSWYENPTFPMAA